MFRFPSHPQAIRQVGMGRLNTGQGAAVWCQEGGKEPESPVLWTYQHGGETAPGSLLWRPSKPRVQPSSSSLVTAR